MQIEFRHEPLTQLSSSALIVFGFEENPAASGTVTRLPAEARAILEELQANRELTGKVYECTVVHRPAGLSAARVLVVGAGKKEKFNQSVLRNLSGTATRYLRSRGAREIAWVLDDQQADPDAIQTIVEGAVLADYDSDPYRTGKENERKIVRFLLASGGAKVSEATQAAVERGRVIAEAQNFTRDLVNEPANSLTPTVLADRTQEMAERSGLDCQVLGPAEIRSLKMGAFMAVAQGSEEPARLIVLRYLPPDAPASPVIGLVGKGITFDTGGISIKPSESMHEMKTDMAGGATMIGVMQAIAQLKPKVRVIAVVPATENMPSGKAYRPGDIVTSMSGKTIEILNTDAEGRLALADALTYAKQLGCTVLIDAATLTGSVMIALGLATTGVFGWDKDWVNRVLSSSAVVGEKMWQLPVDDEYRELYKSSIADLANTGGRYGGSITAAMFVGEFAGDTPWVHLDIAGTRWCNEEKPYRAKGPTGTPVRTLLQLVMSLAKN